MWREGGEGAEGSQRKKTVEEDMAIEIKKHKAKHIRCITNTSAKPVSRPADNDLIDTMMIAEAVEQRWR